MSYLYLALAIVAEVIADHSPLNSAANAFAFNS